MRSQDRRAQLVELFDGGAFENRPTTLPFVTASFHVRAEALQTDAMEIGLTLTLDSGADRMVVLRAILSDLERCVGLVAR